MHVRRNNITIYVYKIRAQYQQEKKNSLARGSESEPKRKHTEIAGDGREDGWSLVRETEWTQ